MIRYSTFILCAFIFLLTAFHADTIRSATGEELFVEAGRAYREGRFQEAIDGYNELIKEGRINGHVYYNLGNSYFRMNKLGQAILYYEKARLLMPREADLRYNLEYARDQIQDAVAPKRSTVLMTFFWIESYNPRELFWVFIVVNIFFWAALAARIFIKTEWTWYLLFVVLIIWVVSAFSCGLKWYVMETDSRAVILREEVDILAGPDPRDTLLFKLHKGTTVQFERSEGEWSLVRLPDEKRGWLLNEAIGKIRP